jgi:hypothetical protein
MVIKRKVSQLFNNNNNNPHWSPVRQPPKLVEILHKHVTINKKLQIRQRSEKQSGLGESHSGGEGLHWNVMP